MPGGAEKCAAAGMDDLAGKPTSMSVLADKLERWMPHAVWPTASPSIEGASEADTSESRHGAAIDDAALEELTGGDAVLAHATLVDYVEASESDLAALRVALSDASADDVRRHVHRIEGASRTVGAPQVAMLAARPTVQRRRPEGSANGEGADESGSTPTHTGRRQLRETATSSGPDLPAFTHWARTSRIPSSAIGAPIEPTPSALASHQRPTGHAVYPSAPPLPARPGSPCRTLGPLLVPAR
jgi:hypothetical protein